MLSGARVKPFVDPESFLIGDIGTGERDAMLEADNIASPSPPTFSPGKKRTTAEKKLYCFEPGCVTINSTRNQLMLAL